MSGTTEYYEIRLKDNFSSGLKSMENNVDNFEKKINNLNTVLSGFGIVFGAKLLVDGIKYISGLGAAAEQTAISFKVLTGDVQSGMKLLSELKQYGVETPYLSRDILDNGKLLLGYGIAADKILPTMKMLGDIAAGDANKLYSLSLAFAQSQSAGRLMGQDLLQMVNAGFNPLKIISDKTGLSMATLKKRMEDGAISAKDVAQAFQSATMEGGLFFDMTEKQSKSFGGRMSTLIDTLEVGLTNLGDALNRALGPTLDKMLDILDRPVLSVAKKQRKNRDEVEELSNLLDQYNSGGAYKDGIADAIMQKFPFTGTNFRTGKPTDFSAQKANELLTLMQDQKKTFDAWGAVGEAQLQNQNIEQKISMWNEMLKSGTDNYGNKMSATEKQSALDEIQALRLEFDKNISELAVLTKPKEDKSQPTGKYDVETVTGKGKVGGKGSNDIGIEKVQSATKQITLNITNLVNEIIFQKGDVNGNEAQMVEAIKRVLLTAVNDVNIVSQ